MPNRLIYERTIPTHDAPAMRMPRVRFTVAWMMAGVAATAIVFGVVAAILSAERAAQRVGLQGACYSSLNNIALGLMNYSEYYRRFPPPFMIDEQGRRTHSWRIVVLPFFPVSYPQALSYDYAGRWDGASNGKLSNQVPGFLWCPSERHENPYGSPFVMINDVSNVDPSAIPANAILVIEAWGSNRNWLDPHDRVWTSPHNAVGATDHPSGFGVVLRDFTVTRVRDIGRIRKEGAYYVLDR